MPTIRTNGIETYYERRGSGPPIVFIHGMFMNTTQWRNQLESLSDTYTTVAYDVRGHGQTGGSSRSRYDIELFVDDLAALLEALEIEQPILCGLSMGGCIAQLFAARKPDCVSGLILADSFAANPVPISARLLFANLRVIAALDRVVRYPRLNRLQLKIGNLLSPGVGGDPGQIQAALEAGPTIPHPEVRKIADAMAAFPGSNIDLAAITAPVLILHGADLPRVMREMHPRIAAGLTNAARVTVREVPDAGHASNIDNPAFFTTAVRDFAAELQHSERDRE